MQVYHFFPNNKRLFETLIVRTSHWCEDFLNDKNKNFDEAGGTKKKGLKCILSFVVVLLFMINCILLFTIPFLTILMFVIVLISIFVNLNF